MRQVVLDTETTGLDPKQGHRIIEIGCVEVINRRITNNTYHQYINPEREIDAGAIEVHGITTEMLADKPRFADIADDFINYVRGAELIIHNAPFDVGFLNNEFKLSKVKGGTLEDVAASVIDSLTFARKLHPGQRNSLDALCKRYDVDNSQRDLHGALLDAEILADVYLAMTGGQGTLLLGGEQVGQAQAQVEAVRYLENVGELKVVQASDSEIEAHNKLLDILDKAKGEACVWRQ